jgi:hypothetical protein
MGHKNIYFAEKLAHEIQTSMFLQQIRNAIMPHNCHILYFAVIILIVESVAPRWGEINFEQIVKAIIQNCKNFYWYFVGTSNR